MLSVYYDPIYTDALDPQARFPRDRYRLLAERLASIPDIQLCMPRLATREEILTGHDETYVDQFLTGRLSDDAVRRIGLRPWSDGIIERTLRLLGGSFSALDEVLAHRGLAANLAGGTHHAFYAHGSGYCIFNDLVLCALRALQHPSVYRVLILDLDVHQGDGTAALLQTHPQVFTCSIHGATNFPFRKQQSDLDVALPDGTTDNAYLDALERTLEQLAPRDFDLILYQAGVDGLAEDRLGHLNLTHDGLNRRNHRVFDFREELQVPLVIFMGGGYADPLDPTLDAFEDLFATAAALSPDAAEPVRRPHAAG